MKVQTSPEIGNPEFMSHLGSHQGPIGAFCSTQRVASIVKVTLMIQGGAWSSSHYVYVPVGNRGKQKRERKLPPSSVGPF